MIQWDYNLKKVIEIYSEGGKSMNANMKLLLLVITDLGVSRMVCYDMGFITAARYLYILTMIGIIVLSEACRQIFLRDAKIEQRRIVMEAPRASRNTLWGYRCCAALTRIITIAATGYQIYVFRIVFLP